MNDLRLFLFGLIFSLLNATQSRALNTGVRIRYPDVLVAVIVAIVATFYALATRYVAASTGFDAALGYGLGSAAGALLGRRFANDWLYGRFHPGGRNAEVTSEKDDSNAA